MYILDSVLSEAAEHSDPRRVSTRLLLLVIVSAVFVSVLNNTMVNVSLPAIQAGFGASEGALGWVITGYMLAFAVGIPIYGRLSDFYSARKIFCMGLLLLAAGSLLCAVAPNLVSLVAGRIVQGAGSAAMPALSSATVVRVLPPGERGSALGLIVSSVGVGAAVGPVVGGVVTQFLGWPFLFYGTLGLSAVLIAGIWNLLPDVAGAAGGRRGFDLVGGLLLASAAGLALFGVTEGQAGGFASPASWGSFAAAAVAALLFVWRIRSAPEPFVSPRLFRAPAYVAASVVGFFTMLANLSCVVLVPLLLAQVNGLSPGAVGLAMVPAAVVVAGLSPYAGRISDRLGFRPPIVFGLLALLISVLAISTFGAGAPAWVVALLLCGVGVGFASVNSPSINAAAAALPPPEVGVGLGIFQMLFFLGGGFGPAILGAFLAFRREAGADALNPLYVLDAVPYSDAFLAMSPALILALAATLWLRRPKDALR